MKKNFTKLVCVGIACFCMSSAMPQERMGTFSKTVEMNFSNEDVRLRADEVEYWWPDSAVTYSAEGMYEYKVLYDKENQTSIAGFIVDGSWVFSDPVSSNGFSFKEGKSKVRFEDANGEKRLWYPRIGANWYRYHTGLAGNPDLTYDNKGNLILMEIKGPYNPSVDTDNYYEYRIAYNVNNDPLLIEMYNYNRLVGKILYEYDEKGNMILCESYLNDNKDLKETAIFDKEGKPIAFYMFIGNTPLNTWLLLRYTLYYYSNEIYTINVEVENNTTVGNDNQGSFDLEVNIPTDSIGNGSITVTFPEGFTLDEKNTSLTLDFAGLFDLTITRQENNSWLLEIKPKTLRNASLRAGEAKKMLQVAYMVDEKLQRGTYNVSVNSIFFETRGGNNIHEPAITVPAVVGRWGVSNAVIESSSIRISDGNLYIRTDKSCILFVFTISGQLFKQQTISAGETILPLPQGIYFVKVGETTKKIIAN